MASKTVGECMTRNPVSVSADTTLVVAAERMREHGIRHLPILDRGALVGLISERDLALIAGIPGIDGDRVTDGSRDDTTSGNAPMVSFEMDESDAVIANPERGYYVGYDLTWPDRAPSVRANG